MGGWGRSLSARRAWIEIDFTGSAWVSEFVALRKESVDRNSLGAKADSVTQVALRKESVDRNREIYGISHSAVSRSPQGERG